MVGVGAKRLMTASNPLKVLYLLHDSRRSGVPAVMASLIRSLDHRLVEPSVLFAYDGVYANELKEEGVAVTVVSRRLPFLWRLNRFLLVFWLPKLLRGVDVVHANSIMMAPAALVARWLGARVVFHLHEKAGRSGWFLKKIASAADSVLFCARNCAVHYAELHCRNRTTILNAILLPSGAHTERSTGRKRIIMLGSINRNKGQDLLLEAFSRLGRDDTDLYIYGTVGLSARGFMSDLQRRVKELGLQERVFFPGPTTEAQRVMQEATLLVHSSLNECLSISVLEAMSHGLPVIANRIAGMDEIITDGRDGFLVTPGDLEELTARMNELLGDEALRQRVGAAGLATVRERFDMKERVDDFVRLYDSLAGGRERP